MNKINEKDLQSFISEGVLKPFNEKRLKKINELLLSEILKRKNPYLFKAKNIQTSEELIKYVLDAFLSSQEETIFGNLMEELAIFACKAVFTGRKAEKGKFKSIDLFFERDNIFYIVSIKSGVNWGNKDQISEMKKNFKKAKKILKTEGVNKKIIAINGCMYGKDSSPKKKDYYKYCGQEFWKFITNDVEFYQKIIIPLDKEAKNKDEDFKSAYSAKINELTREFSGKYLDKSGLIDWHKIVEYVSKQI